MTTTSDPDPLAAYVPRLLRAWPAGRRHLAVDGTLVSADISGFTALSERLADLGREGAEELTALLNVCFSGMIDAAETYGGDVLAFGGDALLLLFRGERHAERAVTAAVAMRAVVAEPVASRSAGTVALGISIGAHSGTFHHLLVNAGHDALVVVGPDASACVRAEGAAPRGGILVTPTTATLVPDGWLGEAVDGGRLVGDAGDAPRAAAPVATDGGGLHRFLPASLAEQVAAGPVHGEHRRVAVGFLEYAGTDDAIGAGRVEEVAAALAAVGAALAAACRRNGAHVLATDLYPDGGKFILTAGAPVSTGDDAAALLRTLREVVDADPGLGLRAGANRGPVFLGPLGAPQRRSLTVMGDAVNLAARLMQAAGAGQVIGSQDVLDDSTTRFVVEELPPFPVKGKTAPVRAAVVGAALRTHETAVDASVPLLGRDDVLGDLLATIASGEQAIALVGATGTGKTRLLQELTERMSRPAVVLPVDRFSADVAYALARRLLRRLLDVDDDSPAETVGAALQQAVARRAPDLLPWLPLLAVPADAAVERTAAVDELDPQFRRARIEEHTSRLVTVLAADRCIAVDDADRADVASRRLLRAIATRVLDGSDVTSTTVVTTANRVDDEQPGDVLHLAPLPDDAVRALVLHVAGDVADRDVDEVVTTAGGSPLFAIELARSLAADEQLPDSVEGVVIARIDRLAAAARTLVRETAVLGQEVSVDVLADVLGADAADAGRWADVDELAEHTGATVRFRHHLYQHVAYIGLAYARRRELHARAAAALAARDAPPAVLSLHHLRAGALARAWTTARAAGDAARAGDAPAEAAELYGRALAAADALAGDGDGGVGALAHSVVAEALGDVAELTADYEDALEAYAVARVHRDDPVDDARLLRKLGLLRVRLGDYDAAMGNYERAMARIMDADGDTAAAERADLQIGIAGVWFRRGDYTRCAEVAATAVTTAEAAGDDRARAHALYLGDHATYLAGAAGHGPASQTALDLFRDLGDAVGEANVLNNLGVRAYYLGAWDQAVDHYRRGRDARLRAGDVVGAATQTNNLAEVLADQGHVTTALEDFATARRVWAAARFRTGVGLATSNIGWAHARSGDADTGVVHLEEARDVLREIGAGALAVDAVLRLAETHARNGRADLGGRLLDDLDLPDDGTPMASAGHRVRGLVRLADDVDGAVTSLRRAATIARAAAAPYEEGCALLTLAGITSDPSDRAAARTVLDPLGVDTAALWPDWRPHQR